MSGPNQPYDDHQQYGGQTDSYYQDEYHNQGPGGHYDPHGQGQQYGQEYNQAEGYYDEQYVFHSLNLVICFRSDANP
jgi:1,3-beta-glucan synthase